MKCILSLTAIAATLALGACGLNPKAPISTDATTTFLGSAAIPGTPTTATATPTGLAKDLQSAEWNGFNAINLKILPVTDTTVGCLDDFLSKHGLSLVASHNIAAAATAASQFTPKNDGVASFAMIAYIKLQQAKGLAAGKLQITASCANVVLNFMSTVLQQAANTLDPLKIAGVQLPAFEVVPDTQATGASVLSTVDILAAITPAAPVAPPK